MKSKYTRYTEDIIENIPSDIEENRFLSASEASQNYGLDASGLIKHIKKYRVLKMTNDINKCGRKYECKHNNICEKCFYKARFYIVKKCSHCKKRCNSICKDFIEISTCSRLLATALSSPEILKLNDFRLIEPNEMNLHQSLMKKNSIIFICFEKDW